MMKRLPGDRKKANGALYAAVINGMMAVLFATGRMPHFSPGVTIVLAILWQVVTFLLMWPMIRASMRLR